MRTICRWVLALLLGLAMTGCGGSSGPSDVERVTGSTVPAVTTTVSTVPASAYPHATTFHLTHRDGYTAEAILRRGELVKTSTITESLTPCKVKPDADAAIPFELRLTNTTPDFSASPSIRLFMDGTGSFWHGHEFPVLVRYSSGPSCQIVTSVPSASAAVSLKPAEPLATSRSVQVSGWFIISGYYSPATPEGDRSNLREMVLEALTNSWDWSVSSGTGAFQLNTIGKTWAVPFDPQSGGGCYGRGECS